MSHNGSVQHTAYSCVTVHLTDKKGEGKAC